MDPSRAGVTVRGPDVAVETAIQASRCPMCEWPEPFGHDGQTCMRCSHTLCANPGMLAWRRLDGR